MEKTKKNNSKTIGNSKKKRKYKNIVNKNAIGTEIVVTVCCDIPKRGKIKTEKIKQESQNILFCMPNRKTFCGDIYSGNK